MTAAAALIPILALAASVNAASCPGFSKTFDLTSASGVSADFDTQAGASGVSYEGSGLKMTLTESNSNIVLQSHETYTLPLKLDMQLKASTVPGIITTMAAWGGDESKDAIDLETAGSLSNLVLLSLFRAGHSDSGYNSDVQVEAPSPLPNWDWMQMPDGYDSSDAAYSMVWTEDAITWTVNGNLAAKYTPKDGAQWLTSNVPIRLGLWATDPSQDWAGQLDWDANPKAEATFTSLTLSCPSDSDLQSNAQTQSSEGSQEAESTSAEKTTQEQESSSSATSTEESTQDQEANTTAEAAATSANSQDDASSSSSSSNDKRDDTSSSSNSDDSSSSADADSEQDSAMAASSGMVSSQRATHNATEIVHSASGSQTVRAAKDAVETVGSSSSTASDDEVIEDSSAAISSLASLSSWGLAAFVLGRLFV